MVEPFSNLVQISKIFNVLEKLNILLAKETCQFEVKKNIRTEYLSTTCDLPSVHDMIHHSWQLDKIFRWNFYEIELVMNPIISQFTVWFPIQFIVYNSCNSWDNQFWTFFSSSFNCEKARICVWYQTPIRQYPCVIC